MIFKSASFLSILETSLCETHDRPFFRQNTSGSKKILFSEKEFFVPQKKKIIIIIKNK